MTVAKTIRTVLVPLDGSETGERAVPWAKAVAGSDAQIVLMEVTPVASTVRSIGGQVIGTAETIQEGYRQMAEQQLDDAVVKWFGKDDKVSTVIAIGDPGEQILRGRRRKGCRPDRHVQPRPGRHRALRQRVGGRPGGAARATAGDDHWA